MSAGAIGSVSGPAAATNRFAELQSEDFIQVMLSELSNQDPFEPTDSSALLEQLSSLRNIETQLELQTKLESLVLQNQVAIAGGLIGMHVAGLDDANNETSGLVTSVRVQDGQTLLELDNGKTLAMDHVTEIAPGTPPSMDGTVKVSESKITG